VSGSRDSGPFAGGVQRVAAVSHGLVTRFVLERRVKVQVLVSPFEDALFKAPPVERLYVGEEYVPRPILELVSTVIVNFPLSFACSNSRSRWSSQKQFVCGKVRLK